MKKLSIVLRVLVVLSVLSATAYAQPYLELEVSNLNPGVGETVQVDVWVKDMPGNNLLTFDICVHYDATSLDVISMQVNDTSVGGCVNSFFSITVDNDADCMRLGGGIMPGSTCEMVGHAYKLATVVLEALTTDGNTICAKTDCQSADGCGLNFNGYVEDETGQVFQITESCATLNAPIPCVLSIDPPSAMVAAGGAIQFTAMETGDCDAPDYQWTDTCVYGNVDSSGYFTADEEIVEESCTVCVTDDNNPDTIETCADVTIEEKLYYYVDGTGGNNANDGLTPGTAWKTITHALSQVTGTAQQPVVIQVAASVYDTVMGGGDAETFPLYMEKYVSLRGAGYQDTILDAEQTNNVIEFPKEEYIDDTVEIEGFEITGGSNFRGGGITVLWADPVIKNCLIKDNESIDINGGGIYLQRSNALITNCVISNNTAFQQRGGGISCGNESGPVITNCSIVDNGAGCGEDEGGGGLFIGHNSSATVLNTILWGNYKECSPDPELDQIMAQEGSILDITYSCIQGGYTGTGNIDSTPEFLGTGNYHLSYTSPCIDAGTSEDTPTSDIDGNDRFDSTAHPNTGGGADPYYDMGAYEYQGDTDGDGVMDDGDESGTVGDNPCTGGATTDCDDNCINTPNPDQADSEGDGSGDLCDNCVEVPNGPILGTCSESLGILFKGTGVTCTSDTDCGSGETCDKSQGDCNDNGIGDVCECYADFDNDGFVYPSDVSIMLDEYGRTDCLSNPPCLADLDGDGYVYPSDLSILLIEYGREDCPVIP